MTSRERYSVRIIREQVEAGGPGSDVADLLAAYDRVSANAAGLQTDLTAAKNRADRLQAELDRVTRERDEARSQAKTMAASSERFRKALLRVRRLTADQRVYCSDERVDVPSWVLSVEAALEGTSGTPREPRCSVCKDDGYNCGICGNVTRYGEIDERLAVSGGTAQDEPQPDEEFFRAGYAAFGVGTLTNPYRVGAPEWRAWNEGWFKAAEVAAPETTGEPE